jgi:cardiolipin synthase
VFVSLRQLPNLITLMRIGLIVPIEVALLRGQLLVTMLLIGVAAVSDGADGFLAKRFGWQTTLGAVLDPAADKLLLATVFVTLAIQGGVPIWLVALAVGRDVILVLGALAYRYRYGPLNIRPSIVSKINTLCQVGFILSVVGRQEFDVLPEWFVTLMGALVLLTVVISGLDYVLTFALRAQAQRTRGFATGKRQGPP